MRKPLIILNAMARTQIAWRAPLALVWPLE